MITPNVWGQGQLFAFSALDGKSLHSDDFIGTLCGDKIGIRFYSNTKRELVLAGIKGCVPEFETVSSDVITINTPKGELNIIYADTRLIVGNVAGGAIPVVLTEGAFKEEIIEMKSNHGNNNVVTIKFAGSGGKGILQPTGYHKVNNIYDMGGNTWEWTTESFSVTSDPCVTRGGRYYHTASDVPAAYRNSSSATAAYDFLSFRVTLFM